MKEKQIELRISSPSHKGLDNILATLDSVYILSKRSLPYPYTDKNTGEVQYTVYVAITHFKKR